MASPKKKNFGDARADYGKEQEGQPFGNYDDDVFAALDAGQVEADSLPIMSIWADKTQPRNIIPREIHGGWTGNPAAMPDILQAWLEAIYDTGADLPIEEILRGKSSGSDKTHSLPPSDEPIVAKFLPVLSLASQIRDIGLQQRIGVIAVGKTDYRIIYGERRWTAFHLLKMFLGDDYSSIPAKVAKVSEWDLAKIQAAENFHQNPLNAIGKARQLAKLLILARKDQQDPPYDSWDALVVDGGCNRPYFAQVADGNIHRIPKGMGEEFERTLNISVEQMRQYRGLLRLTGDFDIDNTLWDMGNERDWSEGFMRDIAKMLDVPTIRKLLAESNNPEEMLLEAVSAGRLEKKFQNTVTTVTVSEDPTPEQAAPKSPFSSTGTASRFKFSDEVMTRDGKGRIIDTRDNTHLVRLDNGPTRRYGEASLSPVQSSESWFDRYVQTVAGKVGQVIVDFGDRCELQYADGGRSTINKEYLSFVERSEWDEAVRLHKLYVQSQSGNMLNKIVHTFQGVAKIIRIAPNSYEVQFPDGDTINMAKTDVTVTDQSHWDDAVAAHKAKQSPEPEAAPALKFKVDDRVTVQVGMREMPGTIRYIKPEEKSPYGVFLDHNKSTHYYAEWMLAPLADMKPDLGWMIGKTFRHVDPMHAGREFEVFDAHNRTEIVNAHGERGVGFTFYAKDLILIDGLDNANSLPPDSSPTNNNLNDWIGKPALFVKFNGVKIPVFIQEQMADGRLRATANDGTLHYVLPQQLEAVEMGETRLSDFMNGNDPDHDHSDLVGKRVKLTNGDIGTIAEVDGKRLVMQFSQYISGGALVEHIVEVLEDEAAEETKMITDVNAQALLRHIGHLTGRENTVLKLINLSRQNAIEAYKAQQLVPDLQVIRDSIKAGFQELIAEVENILEAIVTEAEELTD